MIGWPEFGGCLRVVDGGRGCIDDGDDRFVGITELAIGYRQRDRRLAQWELASSDIRCGIAKLYAIC